METLHMVAIGIVVLVVLYLLWPKKQVAWVPVKKCATDPLSLPYKNSDGKILQINSPFYGQQIGDNVCGGTAVTTLCSSANADQLTKDVAAGKDIDIAANGYLAYFGGVDPCVNSYKYTSLNYRYV
jgi:hypothetical protein